MSTGIKKFTIRTVLVCMGLLTITSQAHAVGKVYLQIASFALQYGVFQSIFAKEMCSCELVDGIEESKCFTGERDNLPDLLHTPGLMVIEHPTASSVKVSFGPVELVRNQLQPLLQGLHEQIGVDFSLGGSATATFDTDHPEFGCRLTTLPTDQPPPIPPAAD